MARPKALLSWSSGKDSAWALHALRAEGRVDVVGLFTTLNATHGRVAMHAVRERLLDMQAAAAGLPVWKVRLPWPCPNGTYEDLVAGVMARAKGEGIEAISYGDLFLEDVRAYRLERHEGTGLEALFPLWGRPTAELAREMIAGGLKAILTCVDPKRLDAAFASREFDAALLRDLPAGVDPCGEQGEFHTFAWAGPMFERAVPVTRGEIVTRDGFVFADLLPAE
ncbi:MAG: adenine nucleotide alpha hydrolase [Planctomycetes bacterium]|nr:adenine nucleotide alpha hydrolase [Planctomycetota bacterium]